MGNAVRNFGIKCYSEQFLHLDNHASVAAWIRFCQRNPDGRGLPLLRSKKRAVWRLRIFQHVSDSGVYDKPSDFVLGPVSLMTSVVGVIE
jgi:hypothetical protein